MAAWSRSSARTSAGHRRGTKERFGPLSSHTNDGTDYGSLESSFPTLRSRFP